MESKAKAAGAALRSALNGVSIAVVKQQLSDVDPIERGQTADPGPFKHAIDDLGGKADEHGLSNLARHAAAAAAAGQDNADFFHIARRPAVEPRHRRPTTGPPGLLGG